MRSLWHPAGRDRSSWHATADLRPTNASVTQGRSRANGNRVPQLVELVRGVHEQVAHQARVRHSKFRMVPSTGSIVAGSITVMFRVGPAALRSPSTFPSAVHVLGRRQPTCQVIGAFDGLRVPISRSLFATSVSLHGRNKGNIQKEHGKSISATK